MKPMLKKLDEKDKRWTRRRVSRELQATTYRYPFALLNIVELFAPKRGGEN